jgi:hypothetical protein
MMIVILSVGSVLCVGLSIWLPYHHEQQVIQKIEGWGGKVETEKVTTDWPRLLVSADRVKEFGVFDRVARVDLNDAAVTDAEIAHLSGSWARRRPNRDWLN